MPSPEPQAVLAKAEPNKKVYPPKLLDLLASQATLATLHYRSASQSADHRRNNKLIHSLALAPPDINNLIAKIVF
jgi:hypothetical protein